MYAVFIDKGGRMREEKVPLGVLYYLADRYAAGDDVEEIAADCEGSPAWVLWALERGLPAGLFSVIRVRRKHALERKKFQELAAESNRFSFAKGEESPGQDEPTPSPKAEE